MSDLHVSVKDTFVVDWATLLDYITFNCSLRQAKAHVRFEVQLWFSLTCERMLDSPCLTEKFIAWQMCRQGFADPKPGHEPPDWERIKRELAEESP